MKKVYLIFILMILMISSGCSRSNKEEVRLFIEDAFKTRADVVFLYKDKEVLSGYFSPEAMEQNRAYLDWSPNGRWNNVKDMKYSTTLRISSLKIDGKRATAEVFETVVVTWDFVDPAKVAGTEFTKEDAWSNRKHLVTVVLNPEGNWIIEQDMVP
ncbi:hypothetical protein [Phosphitispora fastidiosa]|uniref:hypothetical protein n=1 Tax=Phosphitispora fastidiosa TaxID=2837202 RepID=UPI001E2D3BF0|nr:hypothetical protein [Phosphitispora fastidiosa]MBU7007887.1 hypothetical protein [Phosphitispora fastidiosa]